MIEPLVPEFFDGGYWYVVEAVPEVDDVPGWGFEPVSAGASAWYAEIGGTMYCALRTPDVAAAKPSHQPVTVKQVLAAAQYTTKPFARLRGV